MINNYTGGFLLGWFEPDAKPAFGSGRVPSEDWTKHVKSDLAHWQPLWEKVIHRLPILKEIKHPNIYNCPDNFTPDGRWILGESPEVKNYFVAVGMNGNSLQGKQDFKNVSEFLDSRSLIFHTKKFEILLYF